MKILYLHDHEKWAIFNVGRLWLENINKVELTFKNYNGIEDTSLFHDYDFVFFGFLNIYFKFKYNLDKSIIAIHDPIELFPEKKYWHFSQPNLERLELLRLAKNVIVISRELHCLLKYYKIDTYLIPTDSLLPLRDKKKMSTTKCDIHSIYNISARKNLKLMMDIKEYCQMQLKLNIHLKEGLNILPENEYINLLDNHEIYICTSFQEGGPLPAMDAMARGSVVLTTPVGQMTEMIEDGKNGFICSTKDEFFDRISLLARNLKMLNEMRIFNLELMYKKRKNGFINKRVMQFLNILRHYQY